MQRSFAASTNDRFSSNLNPRTYYRWRLLCRYAATFCYRLVSAVSQIVLALRHIPGRACGVQATGCRCMSMQLDDDDERMNFNVA